MSDVFTAEKRRSIMQAVRRRGTKPEQELAAALNDLGFDFRQNVEDLPGEPDILFVDPKLAVFVHGCFWHGHEACRKGRSRPKTRPAYWEAKIKRNRRRDRRVARRLRAAGYGVYTVWACELRRHGIPARLLSRLRRSAGQTDSAAEDRHGRANRAARDD